MIADKGRGMTIMLVAGARPNFMKIAPLMAALNSRDGLTPFLVHTGQHYDERMSDLFFRQLSIPHPDVNLGVGGGTHATQTAAVMAAFEPVVLEHKPRAVLVVGDVNSTLACGLVAAKLGVTLIHVEAGLRSFDRSMPEELNRLLTDTASDLLFCTERQAVQNLRHEGVPPHKIHLVGNVMIDTLHANLAQAQASPVLEHLRLTSRQYALLTLHRPANVDDEAVLTRLLDVLYLIQADMPVIFPVHPRTRAPLARGEAARLTQAMPNLRLIEPAGYLDFLKLTAHARVVLTDSGGVQEETTILRVPCLTLRDTTERPVTAELGSNRVVGTEPGRILAAYRQVMSLPPELGQTPPLWDGQAAQRIADVLTREFLTCRGRPALVGVAQASCS